MAGLITGIAGLAISAGTTAYSFAQANKEKDKQLQYENEANKALAEAKKALQVNYAKQMSIKKEPYNQERMALLNQGAMITQAAAESDRGAASAAGQIYAGQQMGQANIADRQSNDLTNIENAILEEDSRLRDVGVGLDTMELQGAQQAAADARLASQQAMQAGIEGVANTTQQGLAMAPLYSQSKSKTNAAIAGVQDADSSFLQGYDPMTASGRDYRQMKRSNPGFKSNVNYQRGLAGLDMIAPVNSAPVNSAPVNSYQMQGKAQGGFNPTNINPLQAYQGGQLPLTNNNTIPMWQQNLGFGYANPFTIY
jgi:hypothetical protein